MEGGVKDHTSHARSGGMGGEEWWRQDVEGTLRMSGKELRTQRTRRKGRDGRRIQPGGTSLGCKKGVNVMSRSSAAWHCVWKNCVEMSGVVEVSKTRHGIDATGCDDI